VGGYATEVAVADGLRAIAIASPGDEDLVSGFGAEAVVPRGPGAAAAIRDLVPEGVDALIDAANVGGSLLPAVRDGGRVVPLRPFDGEPERGITIDLISVRTYIREQAKLQAVLELAGAKALTPRVAATYGFAEAAEAHRRLEAGGTRGRLVLEPDEA
jgi:D-arabinose 1-dehydrogenase-like Zn-dependent alcohol dehydrogenase